MNFLGGFPMVVLFTIPIVAIIGGITAAIVKSVHRQRLLELAQRERIAAIERGLDPDKLPALSLPPEMICAPKNGLSFDQKQLRRSQNLLIWGFILLLIGIALLVSLASAGEMDGALISGLLTAGMGAALLISARVVRPEPTKPSAGGSDFPAQ